MAANPIRPAADRPGLRIVRSYPVAAEKIWRAWTDPQALSAWFGPGDRHSVSLADVDLRLGGRWCIIRFRTGDCEEHEVGGMYETVEPLRQLAFSWAWRTTPERVSRVALALRAVDSGTELGKLLHEHFFDQAAADNHKRGWPPPSPSWTPGSRPTEGAQP